MSAASPDGVHASPGVRLCSGLQVFGDTIGNASDYYNILVPPHSAAVIDTSYMSLGPGGGGWWASVGGLYGPQESGDSAGVWFHHSGTEVTNNGDTWKPHDFTVHANFSTEMLYTLTVTWSGPDSDPPCPVPLDAASMVGGGGSASMCLPCAVHGATSGVADLVRRLAGLRGDPVDVVRGALVESVTDMSVAARGPSLAVSRTYDSAAAAAGESGVFGVGWSSVLDSSLTVASSGGSSTAVWREPSGAKVSFADDGSGWVPVLSGVSAVVALSGGQFQVSTYDGTVYRFESGSSGVLRLVSVTDRNGYVLSLSWSANQVQLIAHTNPGGTTQAAALNVGLSSGRAVQVRDGAGRVVHYSYTGDDLTQATSLGGGSWSYAYDSSGRLTHLVDPSGAETVNAYGADGRVKDQWDPDAAAVGGTLDPATATQYSYSGFDSGDGLSGTVTVTTPDGAVESETVAGGMVTGDTKGVGTASASTWGYAYDPVTGMPTAVVDPSKALTVMGYSSQGWLSKVTQPSGVSTSFANFDAFGDPGLVTDPAGVETTYSYDSHGNLLSSSTPWRTASGSSLGPDATTTYTRSPWHPDDVTQLEAPDGTVTGFTYSAASGLVVSSTDAAGDETTYGYDIAGHRVFTVSPKGNVSGHDPADYRQVQVVNAAGEPVMSLDPQSHGAGDGFVRYATSGLGTAATGEAWDGLSGGWKAVAGVASATTAGVATLPTPLSASDTLRVSSVIPTGVTGPVGVTFRVQDADNYWAAVDDSGAMKLIEVAGGVASVAATVPTAGYGAGDRIGVVSTGADVSVYRNGVKVYSGATSAFADSAGVGLYAGGAGPVSGGFAAGSMAGAFTGSFYDNDGRPTATFGPRSKASGFTTTSTGYDPDGNQTWHTDENDNTTHQGYGPMGRLTSQSDAANAVTGYGYGPLGRLTSSQAPGKPAVTIGYVNGDYSANPVVPATKTVTDADGVTATTSFNADSEPTSTTYSDGTPTVAYTFDKDGRLTGTTGSAAMTRTYDSLGETLSVSRAGQSTGYEYAAPGRVGSLTYPNGESVARSYDAYGRWTGVTDWNNQATSFGYDADGNIDQVTMPNGTSTTRLFDADDQITSITDGFGDGGTWPATYTRGTGQELTGTSSPLGSASWGYDPAQQVTSASSPPGSYSFDPTGNPTNINGTTQTFDDAGEACWSDPAGATGTCGSPPAGSTTYGYDGDGQRVAAGSDTFTYDATGTMTAAVTPTGSSTYTYTADGLRTSKTVAGTTTTFAWDDTPGTPQLIQDGGDYYIYGPDGLPIERLGADPTRWLMADATGSVSMTTDTTGTLVSARFYDAWGNTATTLGSQPPVSLGWHSQYQDPETGLYYLRHRYYDPATAQLTTPDPLDAITGSRYGYAANDPVNGMDPTGMFGWSTITHAVSSVGHAVSSTVGHVAHDVNNDIIRPVERTNVETDLAVVGVAAGVVALTAATGGLATIGISAEVAATVGFAASATSVGIGAGIAAVDCAHRADARCVLEAASAAAGFAGGGLSIGGDMVSALGAEWAGLGDYMSGVGDYMLGGVWGLGYGIPALFMGDDGDEQSTGCGR